MDEENLETQEKKKVGKRGGCVGRFLRFCLVGLFLLGAFLFWLNGPGVRWLGPKVAGYYLGKAGIEGKLSVGGSLVGGVEIYDVDLRGEGGLERLVVERMVPDYRLLEVVRGRFRGVEVKGLRVDVRVEEKEKEESEGMDLVGISKMMGDIRERIVVMEIDVEVLGVSVKKEDAVIVEVDGSRLRHERGSGVIELELGEVRDGTGKSLAEQDLRIEWGEERLGLERIEVLPVLGFRDLEILLPRSGEVAVTSEVRLGDGVLNLDVGKGFSDLRLDLLEGELDVAEITEGLGVKSPFEAGRITSVAVDLRDFYPDWSEVVGQVELYGEGVDVGGVFMEEVAAAFELGAGEVGVKLTGSSLGTPFLMEASGGLERGDGFVMEGLKGSMEMEKLEEVLKGFEVVFPESELKAVWEIGWKDGFTASAEISVDERSGEWSPLRVKVVYGNGFWELETMGVEGLEVTGRYDAEGKSYEGSLVAEGFQSEVLAPWLRGMGYEWNGGGDASFVWGGSGSFEKKEHRGKLEGFRGKWKMGDEGSEWISASGDVEYDWPKKVEMKDVELRAGSQRVGVDAVYEDDILKLEEVLWFDGERRLGRAAGTVPIPRDVESFEELLEDDSGMVDLVVESELLEAAVLKPWVGGLKVLNDDATGKVSVKISGSLAEPKIDGVVELKNMAVVGRPELPRTDVILKVMAGEGLVEVEAEIEAKDYPKAELSAKMGYRPRLWLEDVEVLMSEKIEGSMDLPKMEVKRFQTFLPMVETMDGQLEGKVVIGGTVGEPKVDGSIFLKGGRMKLKGDNIPEMNEVNVELGVDRDRLVLNGVLGDLEGGTLKVDGQMGFRNESGEGLGLLDVTFEGRGLPLTRNEEMILRANADLKIQGDLGTAVLSGRVGIIDSLFYKDIELIPIGRPFLGSSGAKLPSVEGGFIFADSIPEMIENWRVDVAVKTEDAFLIRGNLGKGEVDVDVKLGGTLGDMRPNGTVKLRNAAVHLPFTMLDVSVGTLRFTPETGFDPLVELRGSAEPRPYRVQIYVHGRASDPQSIMTSQPPLDENEIMTLLATGTTAAGLEDSQQASTRAMQLLIEELRRGRFMFGKQLRPVLALLDDVDFTLSDEDPYDSDVYNSATLKLSRKWSVSAGLGAEGEQRVMAIYRIRFR